MQTIQISPSDYLRGVAKEPYIALKNRYAERNMALNDSPVSLISRPGMKRFTSAGTGPIRALYSSAGSFNSDLFAVSGLELYRIDALTGIPQLLGPISNSPLGDVSMAAAAPIGDVPGYLFIAEGEVLWFYTDNGHALGQLQASGTINNGDVVRMGDVYYQFTTGSVDTGTPLGTLAFPWLVKSTGVVATTIQNLYFAVNNTSLGGVTYSSALVKNPKVEPLSYGPADLFIQAIDPGALGNAIITTETGTNLSWGGGTLINGGNDQLSQILLPDDSGAISLAHINSYIIVVPVQSDVFGTIGKFYWVEPGETTVNPLNFATAERSPDGIHQVITFSDMFWLFGETTTEPWVTTGNPAAPMTRFQGILFDRGSWAGTAVKVKDKMVVVDEEGGVFVQANGQKRVSTPDIEERIRGAIQREGLYSF
jgi:hypothetical protein